MSTDQPRKHGFWWVRKGDDGGKWSMVEVHGWGVTLGNPDLQDHVSPDHERIKHWEWASYVGTEPVGFRSPAERLEAIAQMAEDFCIHCGCDHYSEYRNCQCWNDE